MNKRFNKRRTLLLAGLSVFGIPALLFGASLLGLFPWSPINCSHQDVDIKSGRVHYTRHVLWMQIHQSIQDSALTKALRPEDFSDTSPEWYHTVTSSPGLGHSPHYIFHSAIAQIRELELVWSLAEFTPAARRASAYQVLQLWQQAGCDNDAIPYLQALGQLALAHQRNHSTIDEGDLPRL